MKLRVSIAFALCVAAAFVAVAKPVSHERAMRGAEDWISRSKARHSLRAPSGEMRTVSMDGTNLFHFVALDGGGFVTVAADDAGPAIMGFSASGEMPELDEGSPLLALLVGDAEASRGIARRKGAKRRPQMSMEKRRVAPRRRSSVESTRTRLTASSSAKTSNAGIDAGIDDMRVEPLIKSQWDQKGVNGKPTYNYYFTKYCCGCVATAMAQLMRYHEYPKTAVDPKTFECYVGTAMTPTNMAMKGGVYDWANMPLNPDSSISDAEREAIGRICYDAGVSMRMAYGLYGGDEAGSIGGFEFDPLKNVFKYKTAQAYLVDQTSTLPDKAIRNGILANLDAQSPVLLGIAYVDGKSASNGHSIVADGYGYANGTLYCHLNMGWSGTSDYWYALPEIGTKYNFNSVSSLVYNIFPTAEGEIVSGRVTDPFGNPAADATITARVSYLKTSYTTNVTVSANGVYSLIVPSKNCTTVLSASIDSKSWASTNASVRTTASVSPSSVNFVSGKYSVSGGSLSIGNSWGNDLSLVATNVVEASSIAFERSESSSPTSGFSLAFDGSCGAWYTVWQSEYLPPTWTVFTNIQVSAEGGAAVTLPFDAAKESSFYLITPKEQQ